jgi:hypothetical protein
MFYSLLRYGKEWQRGEAWQCFWCACLPQGRSRDQISASHREGSLRRATAMRNKQGGLHIKVPVRSYNKIILHASCVGDPEPDMDPHVFGPPGSGSIRGTDPASDPDPSLFL